MLNNKHCVPYVRTQRVVKQKSFKLFQEAIMGKTIRNFAFVAFSKREISMATKVVKSKRDYSRKDKSWRKEANKQIKEKQWQNILFNAVDVAKQTMKS